MSPILTEFWFRTHQWFFYKDIYVTDESDHETYILLTNREGRTVRISALRSWRTDGAQRGPYKKGQGPLFSQNGPKQA